MHRLGVLRAVPVAVVVSELVAQILKDSGTSPTLVGVTASVLAACNRICIRAHRLRGRWGRPIGLLAGTVGCRVASLGP